MPRFGLATIFEYHPVGHEFTADDLPLHLTQVDSFEIGLGPDELAARLARLLAAQQAIAVRTLADEWYGPEKDILVTTVDLTPQLAKLHSDIIDLLKSEGAVLKNPQFNGKNFTPHISMYGTKRVKPGERVLIRDLTLSSKVSDADDANRRVLANFNFA